MEAHLRQSLKNFTDGEGLCDKLGGFEELEAFSIYMVENPFPTARYETWDIIITAYHLSMSKEDKKNFDMAVKKIMKAHKMNKKTAMIYIHHTMRIFHHFDHDTTGCPEKMGAMMCGLYMKSLMELINKVGRKSVKPSQLEKIIAFDYNEWWKNMTSSVRGVSEMIEKIFVDKFATASPVAAALLKPQLTKKKVKKGKKGRKVKKIKGKVWNRKGRKSKK